MRRCTLVLSLLAVLLVTGCSADPGAEPRPTEPRPTASTSRTPVAPDESQALGLVGLWRVSGAVGESEQTWLRLDAGEFQLWRECGMIMGSWRASERAFLASPGGASGACVDDAIPAIPWLASVTTYERTGEGWQLTDATGAVVATLSIDGAPEPIETAAEFYTEAPEINDEVRAAFRRVPSLPAPLEPPSDADVLGRWVPVGIDVATDPHVEFLPSGSWKGSDGCNGGAGRWAITGSGEFLATSGASTLMGCDGALVPHWVSSARLAGFDGAHLVLLDIAGTELGRLQRD